MNITYIIRMHMGYCIK